MPESASATLEVGPDLDLDPSIPPEHLDAVYRAAVRSRGLRDPVLLLLDLRVARYAAAAEAVGGPPWYELTAAIERCPWFAAVVPAAVAADFVPELPAARAGMYRVAVLGRGGVAHRRRPRPR